MKDLIRKFKQSFPNFTLVTYVNQIETHLKNCSSILDVGCGNNSPLRLFSQSYKTTGIDAYKPAIEESKVKKIHDNYVLSNVLDVNKKFKKKSFDAVIVLDLIEHLKKEDGYKLLDRIEQVAKKKIIIVTPNGFLPQHSKTNQLQEHLSGWTVEDFEERGYKVQGIYGIKMHFLRREDASIKWQPRLFWALVWGIISETTHRSFTKENPKYSVSLMAVKTLK